MMTMLTSYRTISFLSICIFTVCLSLAPLFVSDLQPRIIEISRRGAIDHVLRTSVTIKVMAGVSIGATLPVMVDILLDRLCFVVDNKLLY